MKKIILALAGMIFAFAVNAQDNKMEPKQEAKPAAAAQPKSHDHMVMKGGKVWVIKDGKTTAMDKDMDMPNGNKVMMDGTVMMKDGSKMTMKEGDHMNMNGDMMKMPAKKMDDKKMDDKKADTDKK
jgi:hypothetical protein